MNIRNRRELKNKAAATLASVPNRKAIVAVYMGASSLMALALSLIDLWISSKTSDLSGLANKDTLAIWMTAQQVLPILQMLVMICWTFGYRKVMMDIHNGRAVRPGNLLDAFSCLWPILRLTVLQTLIYMGLGIACIYAGTMIFMLSPFSSGVVGELEQITSQSGLLYEDISISTELLRSLSNAILPLTLILLAVCAVVILPVFYSMRLSPYWLLENPRGRVRYAIGNSRRMMRGNRWQLFRLDLSFWWFYLLEMLITALCYGDLLLPLVGVTLPFGDLGNSFLFYIAYLLAQFALACAFRNRVEMTYVEAYEILKPQPQSTDGVVLGNIFQM